MHEISSIEDAKALEGVEVGLSDWVVIDQNRIDQFAEATGDYQWIHVDTERAQRAILPLGKGGERVAARDDETTFCESENEFDFFLLRYTSYLRSAHSRTQYDTRRRKLVALRAFGHARR